MHKLYALVVIMAGAFTLFSFSTNPPDGNTGAPGDNLCIQCHAQSNPSQNGTISIEGFPDVITPHESYLLTVVNRVTTGTAVRGGFQVTILGPTNTKAGDFTMPSASSAVTTTGGRQYWDHNPAKLYPDSNVVKWTVQWTAPELTSGSRITWYAAGNIANGNFQETGDRIVTATGSGTIILSATHDNKLNQAAVYPNPGADQIHILFADEDRADGQVYFFNYFGEQAAESPMRGGIVNVPMIPSGIYLLEIRNGSQKHYVRWSKI